MRSHVLRNVGAVVLLLAAAAPAWAQDLAAAEQQIEGLREQLRAVTEQEAGLQARLRRLEEELEPQNVERSVAAVGTTDARALREERRRQLERQKAGVEQQLSSLAASRTRLESAVYLAEAEVVRLRAAALGAASAPPTAPPSAPAAVRKSTAPARKSRPRTRSRPRRRPK